MVECDPMRDPFSLLGALDIALYRQQDERFLAFAEEAVAKLTLDTFPRPDGVDTYKMLPLLAGLVLNRLNTMEGGALLLPYWKRMCAWMQAGLIVRMIRSYEFDLEVFNVWIECSKTIAGAYAEILGLPSRTNVSCNGDVFEKHSEMKQ